MKKRVLICVLILMFALQFILAADTTAEDATSDAATDTETATITTDTEDTTLSQVQKAYSCLENKVKDKCSSLSSSERIFSLMASGKCQSEVVSDSLNDKECWPKAGCTIKATAQAILALDRIGIDSSKAVAWLFSKNKTPTDLDWYMQVDSNEEATCTATYDNSKYSFSITEDKKISTSAGTCLSLSDNGYWLRISPSCYNKEFSISCNKGFFTSLIFKKQSSSTVYVMETTHSASAEGTASEKVQSVCFSNSQSCDYEGTLWASLVLNNKEYNVEDYTPYLMTFAEENAKLLPEAFLYSITGSADFRTSVLQKQKSSQYWDASGDKFYDTAVALLPFASESPAEKTNSINWLLEAGMQDSEGCWRGNVLNTAFLLFSIWTKSIGEEINPDIDCEDSGYYCMSSASCSSGNLLSGYSCPGVNKCCKTQKTTYTCEEQGFELCNSQQTCSSSYAESSDATSTQKCCSGICKDSTTLSECEQEGGTCRFSCKVDETEISEDCDSGICCLESSTPTESKSYLWIWILVVLIILVVLAILFRNKLSPFIFRIKSMFRRGGTSQSGFKPSPRFPPTSQPNRIMPRRIMPSQTSAQQPKQYPSQKSPELDDVLKKLRDIGK